MKLSIIMALLSVPLLSLNVFAETRVTLNSVHLCCTTCQKSVTTAAEAVKGIEVNIDRANNTVEIVARHNGTAQKVVAAIAQAGFYGTSSNKEITMKPSHEHEMVSKSTLTGNHNCCMSCASAIKSSILQVEGVKSVNVKKRSCKVKGQFDVAEALNAANAAGFSVKKKQ